MDRTARSFAAAGLIAIVTHVALPGPAAVQAPERVGTALVTLAGDAVALEGGYVAKRCARAAGGGGISFLTEADGWTVSVTGDRRAGVVPLDGPAGEKVRIQVRGPIDYELASPGGWIQVLPGLAGARLDVPLRTADGATRARLRATFDCG